MAKQGAFYLSVQQNTAEHRRLWILKLLAGSPGAMSNEEVLYSALPKAGHAPSFDMLRNDLMWLAEMRLIELEPTTPWVAKILRRGEEVASGRARAYGIYQGEI